MFARVPTECSSITASKHGNAALKTMLEFSPSEEESSLISHSQGYGSSSIELGGHVCTSEYLGCVRSLPNTPTNSTRSSHSQVPLLTGTVGQRQGLALIPAMASQGGNEGFDHGKFVQLLVRP